MRWLGGTRDVNSASFWKHVLCIIRILLKHLNHIRMIFGYNTLGLIKWDSLEGGGDGCGGNADVVAGVVWVAHAAHQAGSEIRPHLVSVVANWSG